MKTQVVSEGSKPADSGGNTHLHDMSVYSVIDDEAINSIGFSQTDSNEIIKRETRFHNPKSESERSYNVDNLFQSIEREPPLQKRS